MDGILKFVYALLLLFSFFLNVTNGKKCFTHYDCEKYCPEGFIGICNIELAACYCM
ncbi:putative Late nodulin [Lupinus albus]|uniref:Putative Late nodulin n=1 Tax=Lupinus albus TaxID=3870 RepID=A0A6A4NYD5_LUPAL|nr:putative Late nodulin [Lupinus albus]